jgi:hypothetical protein
MLNHYDQKTGQLRGLGGKSVKLDPNAPAPKLKAGTRLDPKYWAAFNFPVTGGNC